MRRIYSDLTITESYRDKIQMIMEALDLVAEADELVIDALSGLDILQNFEAYGGYGFDQLLGNGNPYDGSLPKLISYLEKLKNKQTEDNISIDDIDANSEIF